MNERMIELAKQANIFIGKDSYGIFAVIPGHEKGQLNRQGKAESYDALEKLAELIVRECADIGERYADGNYEVRNQILEHFGIEEE